jgi:sugar lactone lactonase YvrE
MDGTNMFSFTSPGLISPAGLAIDDLGILFVAGFGSFNIHQLKLDGNDIENTIILKKEDGVKQSKALCFNKDRSQLYKSSYEQDTEIIYS